MTSATTTPTPPAYVREFETTIGVPNGSRVLFTLTYAPVSSLKTDVYLNGLLQREGPTYDYVLSGQSLFFMRPPSTGDFVTVQYYTQ
jgi:hypothetical protein